MVVFRDSEPVERGLPPNVWGRPRGRLLLTVDEIFWIGSSPGEVHVEVQWWGDAAKYTFKPQDIQDVASPRRKDGNISIEFHIRTSRALFESYLRNCEKLVFHILKLKEEIDGKQKKQVSQLLGTAVYSDMLGLCARGHCESYCPIFSDQLVRLGDLKVLFELEFFRRDIDMKKMTGSKRKQESSVLKNGEGFPEELKKLSAKDEESKMKEEREKENDEKERALAEVINRGNELRKAMMMSVLKDCSVGEIDTVIRPEHIREVIDSARDRRSKLLAEHKDVKLIDYLLGKDMSKQDEALALKTLECISPTQSMINLLKPSSSSDDKKRGVCNKEDIAQRKIFVGERGISSQGGSSTTSRTVVSYSEPTLREKHSSRSTGEDDVPSIMDSINCYRLTIESVLLNSMGLRKVNHGAPKSRITERTHHVDHSSLPQFTVEYSEPVENELPKPVKVKQFKCVSQKYHHPEIIFGGNSEHCLRKNGVFSWPHLLYRVLGGTTFRVLWRHSPHQKMATLLGTATAPSKAQALSDPKEDIDDTNVTRFHTRLCLPLFTNIGMTAGHIKVFIEIGKDMKLFGHALLEEKENDSQIQDSSDNCDSDNRKSKGDVKWNVSTLKQALISNRSKKHPKRPQENQDLDAYEVTKRTTIEHERISRPESSKALYSLVNHPQVKEHYKDRSKSSRSLTEHGDSEKNLNEWSHLNVQNPKNNQHLGLRDIKGNHRTYEKRRCLEDDQRNLYPEVIQIPLQFTSIKDQEVEGSTSVQNHHISLPELKVAHGTSERKILERETRIQADTEVEGKPSKNRKQRSVLCHLCRAQEAENFDETSKCAGSSAILAKGVNEASSRCPKDTLRPVSVTRNVPSSDGSSLSPNDYTNGHKTKHCCYHSSRPCCCSIMNSRMADKTAESNVRCKDILGVGNYPPDKVRRRYYSLEEEHGSEYYCCSSPMEYDFVTNVSKSQLPDQREKYHHHSKKMEDDEMWKTAGHHGSNRQKADHMRSRMKVAEADFLKEGNIHAEEISRLTPVSHHMICHEMMLSVDRVTEFPLFLDRSDLDCFVSYSFPTIDTVITGSSRWTTEAITGSTDANFNSVFSHNMKIDPLKSLAMVLSSWCAPIDDTAYSCSNLRGITLRLWARKYDPHPRDYIVATALLPYSKLFAMEMKFNRQKERKLTIKETLYLPLTPMPCSLTSELMAGNHPGREGFGAIHITVTYKNYAEPHMSCDFLNTESKSNASKFGLRVDPMTRQKIDSKNDKYYPKTDRKGTHDYRLSQNKCMNDYDSKVDNLPENFMAKSTNLKRNWVLDEPTKLEKDGSSTSSTVDDPHHSHLSTILEGSAGEDAFDFSSASKKTDFERLELKYDLKDLNEGNFEEASDEFSVHESSKNGDDLDVRDNKWDHFDNGNEKEDDIFEIKSALEKKPLGKCGDEPKILSYGTANSQNACGQYKDHCRIDQGFEGDDYTNDNEKIWNGISDKITLGRNKVWGGESLITTENTNETQDRIFDVVSRVGFKNVELSEKCKEESVVTKRKDCDEEKGDRTRFLSAGTDVSDIADVDKSTQTSETLGFNQKKPFEKSKISRGSNTDLVYDECVKEVPSEKSGKEEFFFARVEIERAFNLPLILVGNRANGDCQKILKKPSTYVSFMGYVDGKPKELKTKVIAHETNPIWDSSWEVMLPAKLLHKCDSPLKFVVHEVSALPVPSSTSSSSPQRSPLTDTIGDIMTSHPGASGCSNGSSKCFADIDLTSLSAGLPFLCGWFYLSNYTRSCGQIKIGVTPLEDISRYRTRWLKEYSLKRYQEVDCGRLSGSSRSSEVYLAQGLYSRLPNLLHDSSDLMYSQVSEVDLFKATGDSTAATGLITSNSAQAIANQPDSRDIDPNIHEQTYHHCVMANSGHNMDMMTTSFMSLSLKEKLSELEAMTEGMKKKLNQDKRKKNNKNLDSQENEDTGKSEKEPSSRSSLVHQCPLSNQHFEDLIENMGKCSRKKEKKKQSPERKQEGRNVETLQELSGSGRVFHTGLFRRLGLDQKMVASEKNHCWRTKDSLEEGSSSDGSVANPDDIAGDHVCMLDPSECSSLPLQDQTEGFSTETINRVLSMLRTASPCQSTSRKEPDGGSRTGHHNQDEENRDDEETLAKERRTSFVDLTAEEIERLVQKIKEKLMQKN